MSIAGQFTEPGVYSQFQPSTALPVLPGGARVAAFIGAGRTTNIVKGESVVRGVTPDGADALLNVAVSLGATILDENQVLYHLGLDYSLGTGLNLGKVAWNLSAAAAVTGTLAQPYAGLVGKTMIIAIAGGAPQTYTFVSGDFVLPGAATALEVVTALNLNITGITATVDTGAVKIATTATNNSSLLINNGTSNAILGFTDGTYLVTPLEPASGVSYSVDYEYAKVSADYVPTFYFSLTDVINAYGEVSTVNTLSLAASIAFNHGASVVAAIQIDPVDGALITQFRNALTKLATVQGINIVVPLYTNPSFYADVKNHVDLASSTLERKERIGILGLSGSPALGTVTGYANGLDDKRMVLCYPPSCQMTVGTDANSSTLDGSFIAAAVAGIRTSRAFDVADPLTRKELVGFDSIPDTLLRSEKNLLAANGVLVIENVGGIPRVRWGLTTNPSTVDTREVSIVEVIDFTASSMRQLLEAIFVGQKILSDTPSQVRSTITTILSDLVRREILTAFGGVSAEVDNADTTQINVTFQIAPVNPLNFILISFSLQTA